MRTHDASLRTTNSFVSNCWLLSSGTNDEPPAVSYKTVSILLARGVLVKLDESPWYLTDYRLAPEWKGGQGGKLVESFIS
jgi:hypothetical protein